MQPGQLNAVRTGPRGGTPVVLLHPVGLELTYWGAQLAALRQDYDVVACDLPGHGASPGTPADWTLPRATDRIQQFVRTLGSSGVGQPARQGCGMCSRRRCSAGSPRRRTSGDPTSSTG